MGVIAGKIGPMAFVYILASRRNGTFYIGQTKDLSRRVAEHKAHQIPGFTAKYDVSTLVYFEACDSRDEARLREKQLKEWRRSWKVKLIEASNPDWLDLDPNEPR